jgi:hypothetical protein
VAEIDDQTLTRADIGRKAIAQVKQAAAGLLQRTLWATTAKELSLPVRTDMPNEVLELMSLYPQRVRTQAGGGIE